MRKRIWNCRGDDDYGLNRAGGAFVMTASWNAV